MARPNWATPSRRGGSRGRRAAALALLAVVALALSACGGGGDDPSAAAPSPSAEPSPFPTAVFADLAADPVTDGTADTLQAALAGAARGGGATATVVSAAGIWSGAVGRADRRRPMRPEDQLAIGSITKPVVAAQVMSLVEAGEVALDDPVDEHLPEVLKFDTGGATVGDLLAMRSGIPDPVDEIYPRLSSDPRHRWTLAEVLDMVGPDRAPPGEGFEYSNTNYALLGLVVEHVTGRPLHEALRAGVLAGDGVDRLVLQPGERPTPPVAMPFAAAPTALEANGGYLPSLAATTAAAGAGAMASDSASLARWFARLCGGEVVSQRSLAAMATVRSGYGLGLERRFTAADGPVYGHGGVQVGFAGWAGCYPEAGVVVVALTNDEQVDMAITIADALAAVPQG